MGLVITICVQKTGLLHPLPEHLMFMDAKKQMATKFINVMVQIPTQQNFHVLLMMFYVQPVAIMKCKDALKTLTVAPAVRKVQLGITAIASAMTEK